MILSCGEALIDMLPTTASGAKNEYLPVTGGAAVNSAIALARLGQSAGYFGGLSTDHYGELLISEMQTEGIDTSRNRPVDAPTTLAFISIIEGSPSYSFRNANGAGRLLNATHLPDLEGVNALVFGGLSLIHRPAAGAFEALMQMAGAERVILLDANIRPALIKEEEDNYRTRLTRMIAMADIVKMSDEDIDWLHPDPPEQLLQGRAALVVHTHGPEGATFHSRHGSQHLPASPVTVVDTVGAGDTFNAGLLASLAKQELLSPQVLARATNAQLTRAVAYGIRAATFSVTRLGANPPTTKELSCAH